MKLLHEKRIKWLIMLMLVLMSVGTVAQSTRQRTTTLGGKYQTLRPEQRTLIQKWVAEYNKINGTRFTAVKIYDDLPASYKTTFDAVTNALLSSRLTDENGRSLGTALSLVEMVETIHGKIPHVRGDQQFRIYVLLKPGAIDKLHASKEFKRIGDNTVFHKGYPINFRQSGGAPSIQFSITKTGRRADIDVDYRSSAAYAALFNGHLTSANSDVRAGNNYDRHVKRWQGLFDWWKNLLDKLFLENLPTGEALTTIETSDSPRIDGSKDVHEAVNDFFDSWLVKRKPLDAAAYLSIKSYPCIVEFHDGSAVDSPLARAHAVKQMKDVNARIGQVRNLRDAIQMVPLYAPGSKPVNHPYSGLFTLEQLPDKVAYEMDCRIRYKMKMVEEVDKPGSGFSNYYGAIVSLKAPEYKDLYLFQVWSKEGKDWKLVSWHFEHPFKEVSAPRIAGKVEHEVNAPVAAPDQRLIRVTYDFLVEWLLGRNIDKALSHLAPEAYDCAHDEIGIISSTEPDHRKRVREFFSLIASEAGRGQSLEDILVSPDVSHDHLVLLDHPALKAYVLARTSDELSDMFHCGKRLSGMKYEKGHAEGAPTFNKDHYKTIFQLKRAGEHAAALKMIWEKQGGDWKVISIDVIAH